MKFEFEKSVTREEGLDVLISSWSPNVTYETIPLDEALGRVTATEVTACLTLPITRASRIDGVAVRSADFADGMPDTRRWQRGLDWAQADTGDDFPDSFDAVVAIENVEKGADGSIVFVQEARVEHGTNVSPSGSIVRSGDFIAPRYARLTPELVAACAVAGLHDIEVLKKPVVAFIPTGSELVAWGSYPDRGQNIEANSLLVRGMVCDWGADFIGYPIVRDVRDDLASALDRALAAADIVIINGGSSRGEEDYNSELLRSRSEFFLHGVRAVPGRPIGMAVIKGKPVINMPGPVAAAFLCTDWMIRGLVAYYLGVPAPKRRTIEGRLTEDLTKPCQFERFVRVTISHDDSGEVRFTPLPHASTPFMLMESDAMVVLPIGVGCVRAGDVVQAQLLKSEELICPV